jgi:hypothetical protein
VLAVLSVLDYVVNIKPCYGIRVLRDAFVGGVYILSHFSVTVLSMCMIIIFIFHLFISRCSPRDEDVVKCTILLIYSSHIKIHRV